MRNLFPALLATAFLAGCGGPVIGSIIQTESPPAAISTNTGDDVVNQPRYHLPTYGLPVAYFPITVKRGEDCELSVALDKPVMARDPSANYSIAYHHHSWTEDSVKVETDNVGLLMGINSTSENKSIEAINQAVSLATSFMKTMNFEKDGKQPPANNKKCTAFSLQTVLNPLSPDGPMGVDQINNALKATNAEVETPEMVLAPLPKQPDDAKRKIAADKAAETAEAADCAKHADLCVFFRAMRTYVVTVKNTESGFPNQSIKLFFQAPDIGRTYCIPLVRRDLVKFDVELGFDHGVLTSFKATDPSELLAVLQMPSDAVKAILGLKN